MKEKIVHALVILLVVAIAGNSSTLSGIMFPSSKPLP
jgi:hypothetical protein